MDFVVSKVAMSVCALLVLSVLAGAFSSERFVEKDAELESVAEDLSLLAERIWRSGSEIRMTWAVPFLSTGEGVEITIENSVVWAKSATDLAVRKPSCGLHTWAWDCSELNSTTARELDSHARQVNARSGQSLELRTEHVLFESQTKLMVFVSLAD
ncbi:MAG: hypothetical protein ACUVT7_04795 [Thermoplasmata archaeon]